MPEERKEGLSEGEAPESKARALKSKILDTIAQEISEAQEAPAGTRFSKTFYHKTGYGKTLKTSKS